jgi:hypothetical protein
MNNVQLLIQAGLILGGNLPSPADQATINALQTSEVQALINIYQTVGNNFLVSNCNPGTVAPGQNSRTIGIVF